MNRNMMITKYTKAMRYRNIFTKNPNIFRPSINLYDNKKCGPRDLYHYNKIRFLSLNVKDRIIVSIQTIFFCSCYNIFSYNRFNLYICCNAYTCILLYWKSDFSQINIMIK